MSDSNFTYGDPTLALIDTAFADGADHVVALMRHSARTFRRDIHDLLNPLTDEGRDLCRRFGRRLPEGLTVRGYSSPAQRCIDTAQIAMDAYAEAGGHVTRVRPVEALGVAYVLDQQRMWKGLSAADGMADYIQQWFDNQTPNGVLMPPQLAASMVLQQMVVRLEDPLRQPALDLCVSHDFTVMMARGQLLEQAPSLAEVEFLDALVLYRLDGELRLASHHGPARVVTNEHYLS